MGLDVRGWSGPWACWCAGCGRRDLAGALPQTSLGVVSERASTGSGPGVSSGLGVWLGLVGDARFFFSAFLGHRSAFARSTGGPATAGALLRLRIHRWWASRRKDSAFAWTVPPESRIVRHPTAKCTHDSSLTPAKPNASAFATGSRRRRRNLSLQRMNAASCVHPSTNPQPETPDERRRQLPGQGLFGDHTQRRPRQRSSRTRPRRQQRTTTQTTRGSAPATPPGTPRST